MWPWMRWFVPGRSCPAIPRSTRSPAVRTEFNIGVFARVGAPIRANPGARARLAGLLVIDLVSGRSGSIGSRPGEGGDAGQVQGETGVFGLAGWAGTDRAVADRGVGAEDRPFRREARTTDVGDLRDVGEDKRWTLVASLVHDCRTAARDEVATMFCKRMAAIHKKGRERLEELREQHRAESNGCWACSGTCCRWYGMPRPHPGGHRLAAGLADRRARGGGDRADDGGGRAGRADGAQDLG